MKPLRAFLVLTLLPVVVGLVSLAYARPPDPTWISGIYDDGDYDDVVIAITLLQGQQEPSWVEAVVLATIVVEVISVEGATVSSTPIYPAFQTRAPPIA
jgi:hypothetical protein